MKRSASSRRMNVSMASPSGKSGERASSTTAETILRGAVSGLGLSGRSHLSHPARLDLVHEATDLVLVGNERTRLDSCDRLANVLFEIIERLSRPLRLHTRFVLNLPPEIVVPERQHAAMRVENEHNLFSPDETLRDRKRTDFVVGDDTAGIADHVSIAFFEPQQGLRVQACIHARDDCDPTRRWQWKPALVERLRIRAGVLE